MTKIKDFTLASKNLGWGHVPPSVPYTPPAHVLMPDGFSRVPLQRNTFNVFQYEPQCCLFSTVRPSWSSGKMLAANAGGLGFKASNPTKGKFCVFTFYSN